MIEHYATPHYIIYSIPFFLILMVVEIALSYYFRKGFYRLNDSISNLTMGLYSQIAAIFYAGFVGLSYVLFYEKFRCFEIPRGPGTFVVCFILVDFFYYWFHRSSHEIAVIWGSHEAHHQSEEYNLSVALRQGAIQQMFSCLFYIPLAIVGFYPVEVFICIQFNTIFQFWIHTRFVKKLGFLEWFLNTPSHHINQAVEPILSFWSRRSLE